MDNRTESLAPGVWRVEVGAAVNAYVVAHDRRGDAEGLTVVDTGTPSGGPRLVRSIRMLGLDPRAVREVLLTHHHPDHTGSAARFATSSAAPLVRCGARDLDVVRGARAPDPAPGDATRLGRLLGRVMPRAAQVQGALPLVDSERVEASGAEVLATPGHTPGSVSFLLPDVGVLLAGDALTTLTPDVRPTSFAPDLRPPTRLTQGPRFLASALRERPATLRRLAGVEATVLGVGHGPVLRGDVQARIAQLAERVGAGV